MSGDRVATLAVALHRGRATTYDISVAQGLLDDMMGGPGCEPGDPEGPRIAKSRVQAAFLAAITALDELRDAVDAIVVP